MTSSSEDDSRADAGGNRPMKMAKKDLKAEENSEETENSEISTITISDSESEESTDKILETRDLLVEFGATDDDDDLEKALEKLEQFLNSSKLECKEIDVLTKELLEGVEKLTAGLGELGDIIGQDSVENVVDE